MNGTSLSLLGEYNFRQILMQCEIYVLLVNSESIYIYIYIYINVCVFICLRVCLIEDYRQLNSWIGFLN